MTDEKRLNARLVPGLGGMTGAWNPETDEYITGTGQILGRLHPRSACEGRPCVVHDPSEHHLRHLPTHFRDDKGQMERICEHGVGHPDPDDLAWHASEGREHMGVHGCDLCCLSEEDHRKLIDEMAEEDRRRTRAERVVDVIEGAHADS